MNIARIIFHNDEIDSNCFDRLFMDTANMVSFLFTDLKYRYF